MKIGIDISQTAYKGSGVARYTHALATALALYDKNNDYVFFYSSLRIPLDPTLRNTILQNRHQIKEFKLPPTLLSLLWNQLHIFPIEKFVGDVDIFMTSDWTEPPSKKALKISTLHDMIVYTYPETSQSSTTLNVGAATISPNIVAQQKKRHALLKRESDGMFVDSEHTKNDAMQYLHIDRDKLHLLYPAVEVPKIHADWDTVQNKYALSSPYILTVGKLEPRKNIRTLIEAFLSAKLGNITLLIVGDKGWGDRSEQKAKNVRFLGFVPDEELATLYQKAEFFVFPSLYEGFGYPVVEAMGHQCPVACSDSSSLTEIGKDAALLFNPHNVGDISQALNRLHNDSRLRSELSKKGYERYKSFSLENFARNFVKIAQHIYDDNRR